MHLGFTKSMHAEMLGQHEFFMGNIN